MKFELWAWGNKLRILDSKRSTHHINAEIQKDNDVKGVRRPHVHRPVLISDSMHKGKSSTRGDM